MASITSMMNSTSSMSSIYGNRNVISGLASGMDTETMIENAVSGIKTKIQNLLKKRTKIEWQQEAYRSIIDKAATFNTKYTSYTSKTNLLSSSFFSNAVNTAVLGTYADKITASGKSSSEIKINAVKQLATAAAYTVSGLGGQSVGSIASAIGGEDFNISEKMTVSNISGSLTFQYGGTNGTTFDISFDELEDIDGFEGNTSAEKLANAINKKLSEVSYTYTKNGYNETTTADQAIKAVADSNGSITFTDGLGNGNKISISSSSGKIKSVFGLGKEDGGDTSIKVGTTSLSNHNVMTYNYLSDKTLGISLNGVSKTINLSDVIKATDINGDNPNESFTENLQKELDKAFGANRVTVGMQDNKLSFTPSGEGDVLSLGGSGIQALGFESGDANYINTSKKVSDLMGDIFTSENRLKPVGEVNTNRMTDAAGNKVRLHEDGNYYRVNADGKFIYDFSVNGTNISLTEDTTLENLMNSINSNAEAGVKVSYSKLTNEFKFTATETGANGKIEFGGLAEAMFSSSSSVKNNFSGTYGLGLADGQSKTVTFGLDDFTFSFDVTNADSMEDIAKKLNDGSIDTFGYTATYNKLSGQIIVTDETGKTVDLKVSADNKELKPQLNSSYTSGQDAVMDVEINGKRFENLTRNSNSFDLDGLTVNVKGTFDAAPKEGEGDYEPITFNTTTDSDKIIDAIRDFVNDYNEMVTELKGAYSTMPLTNSNKQRYEPLTAEQEEQYSESELKAYNEKAKTGILFGDTTLSNFYSKLLNAIQPGGTDGQTLRDIGIGTSYSDGLTTLSLDEDKLRAALDSDPDKVKSAFAKTKEGGSSSDGLMQTLQNTLNTYVKTTGEPKGVLITRAGSVKAPTSLNSNSLQTQINSLDSQIDRWQDKMSDQIDRYTTQFSRLEQLIAEMNSQASAFSGLMGGSTGY